MIWQSEAATALAMRIHDEAQSRRLERPKPPMPQESEYLTLLKRIDRYLDTHPGGIRLDLRIAIKKAVKG